MLTASLEPEGSVSVVTASVLSAGSVTVASRIAGWRST
jgi:hypothetical protein